MKIFEKKEAIKMIKKLPTQIKKRYEFWKNIVFYQGAEGLTKIKGFKDHPLQGEWKGYRSSYLNSAWRMIYRVESTDEIYVLVERVNKHDYKGK